jgi:hypothetical protein
LPLESPRRRPLVSCPAGMAAAFGLAWMLTAMTVASTVNAQQYLAEGSLALATGLEAGDSGEAVQWQRARTSVWAGLELRVDERPKTGYQGRLFVELERSLGVGAELGVSRALGNHVQGFAGVLAVVAPQTLFGGTVRLAYPWPLEHVGLLPWISLNALPFGEDAPQQGGVFWLLLGLGATLPL